MLHMHLLHMRPPHTPLPRMHLLPIPRPFQGPLRQRHQHLTRLLQRRRRLQLLHRRLRRLLLRLFRDHRHLRPRRQRLPSLPLQLRLLSLALRCPRPQLRGQLLPVRLAPLPLRRVNLLHDRLRVGRPEPFVQLSPVRREHSNPLALDLQQEPQTKHHDRCSLVPPCLREGIAVLFLAQSRVQKGQVAPVRVSPCARKRDKVAAHLPRALVAVLGHLADNVLGDNDLELCPPVLAPVLARPVVRRCYRHCQTKCRPRRNLANRYMRANRRNANGKPSINARLKASASCIPHASALAPVVAVSPQLQRWFRNRVLLGK